MKSDLRLKRTVSPFFLNLAPSWTVSGSSKSQSKEGAIGYFISKMISLLCKGIKGEFRNYHTDASKVPPHFDLKYFWNLGWDFTWIWANFWNFVNRSKTCFNRDKTYFCRLNFCFWKTQFVFKRPKIIFSWPNFVFDRPKIIFSRPNFVFGKPKMIFNRPNFVFKNLKLFSIGPILFSA